MSNKRVKKSANRPSIGSLPNKGFSFVMDHEAEIQRSGILQNPKKALKFLQEAGIITKSGKLSVNYGGDK
jgi:hypothetical protein